MLFMYGWTDKKEHDNVLTINWVRYGHRKREVTITRLKLPSLTAAPEQKGDIWIHFCQNSISLE